MRLCEGMIHCRGESFRFPPEEGKKFYQISRLRVDLWQGTYRMFILRNSFFSMCKISPTVVVWHMHFALCHHMQH